MAMKFDDTDILTNKSVPGTFVSQVSAHIVNEKNTYRIDPDNEFVDDICVRYKELCRDVVRRISEINGYPMKDDVVISPMTIEITVNKIKLK